FRCGAPSRARLRPSPGRWRDDAPFPRVRRVGHVSTPSTPVTDPALRDRALAHAHDLATFVEASPSSYHAAHEVARRLEAVGFERLDETAAWPRVGDAGGDGPAGGRYVVVRDGAVIAWAVPAGPGVGREGGWQAGVEIYGGLLLNSWLDRELELAGRLVTADGEEHLVRTGPLLRIPQLAIHLDRAANDGLTLDKQQHTQPVWG